MLATTIGLSFEAGAAISAMPEIAPAALARIGREIRLSPAMSTMLGIIVTSFMPIYTGALSLAASVETISLGKPTGKARMAAVLIAVPPPPPRERMPSIFRSTTSLAQKAAAASAIAATASPRSVKAWLPTSSDRDTSGFTVGSPWVPVSISSVRCPRWWMSSATKECSSPFVSSVPRMAMVFMFSPKNRKGHNEKLEHESVDRCNSVVNDSATESHKTSAPARSRPSPLAGVPWNWRRRSHRHRDNFR